MAKTSGKARRSGGRAGGGSAGRRMGGGSAKRPGVEKEHHWLMQLTGLPTAAGREDAVIAWLEAWAADRPGLRVRRDKAGNRLVSLAAESAKASGARGGRAGRGGRASGDGDGDGRPLVLAAHMDHPALVVIEPGADGRSAIAELRGGVMPSYLDDAKVTTAQPGMPRRRGRVVAHHVRDDGVQVAEVAFGSGVKLSCGDILPWDVGRVRTARGRLRAPACDNLAGVAAAVCAMDRLHDAVKRKAGRAGRNTASTGGVHLLLTRAEEVGFVGAIAACRSQLLPKSSRIIVLENSKSYAESPIGGGPIVRVGDRTSVFDPSLTQWCCDAAEQLAGRDERFVWQRRLMPGGTCEATAFCAFGYEATCLCLPLGNYHNMGDDGVLAAETISLGDFDGLVALLEAIAAPMALPGGGGGGRASQVGSGSAVSLVDRLNARYEQWRRLFDEG